MSELGGEQFGPPEGELKQEAPRGVRSEDPNMSSAPLLQAEDGKSFFQSIFSGETALEPKTPESLGTLEKHGAKDILEGLHPEAFVDQDGNRQIIYTFTAKSGAPVKAVFFAREDIPFSQNILDGRQGFIFGQPSPVRQKEDWDNFAVNVRDSSVSPQSPLNPLPGVFNEAVQSGKATIFVGNGPAGLLDLAFTLGVEDAALRESRQKLTQKKMDNTANDLLNGVIAANIVGTDKSIIPSYDHEGEALAVLKLMGDQPANAYIEARKADMKDLDSQRREKEMAKTREQAERSADEPLRLEKLAAVHLTKYLPEQHDGRINIKSTFEGSGEKIPRLSVHWALNHPVAGHMYGSWDEQPYAVISPLSGMIDRNGPPAVLNTVDTFFEVTPGRGLELPEGSVLVRPGEMEPGKVFETGPHGDVKYKVSELQRDEIDSLVAPMSDRQREVMNEEIIRSIVARGYSTRLSGKPEEGTLTPEEEERLIQIVGGGNSIVDLNRDIINEFGDGTYRDTVARLLTEAGVQDKIPQETFDAISQEIHGVLLSLVKRTAIEQKIADMGYTVQPGGMWSWGDSMRVTRQTQQLGVELGSPVIPHTNHISHELEEGFVGGMGVGPGLTNLLISGEISPKAYKDEGREFVAEKLPQVSPQSRRMLHLIGMI